MLVSVIAKLLFYGDRCQCLYALADERGAAVDEARINLNQTGTGKHFLSGVGTTQNATYANDRDRISQLCA
jgi:hypothetical protein